MAADELWVITEVDGRAVAFPAASVLEMLMLPKLSRPPGFSDALRGVVELRGTVIPALSLRRQLGLPEASEAREELVSLLRSRLRDHEDWLDELERAVRESRPFTKTTDPHRCAFGQWYDTYRSPLPLLQAALKAFDAPHREIHACAESVLRLAASGDLEAAQYEIQRQRHTSLRRLTQLFEHAIWAVEEALSEIAVVLSVDGRPVAVSVDQVDSLQPLAPTNSEPIEHPLGRVGRARDGRLLLVADVTAFRGVLAAV